MWRLLGPCSQGHKPPQNFQALHVVFCAMLQTMMWGGVSVSTSLQAMNSSNAGRTAVILGGSVFP